MVHWAPRSWRWEIPQPVLASFRRVIGVPTKAHQSENRTAGRVGRCRATSSGTLTKVRDAVRVAGTLSGGTRAGLVDSLGQRRSIGRWVAQGSPST